MPDLYDETHTLRAVRLKCVCGEGLEPPLFHGFPYDLNHFHKPLTISAARALASMCNLHDKKHLKHQLGPGRHVADRKMRVLDRKRQPYSRQTGVLGALGLCASS
jgi:hypothetical protein